MLTFICTLSGHFEAIICTFLKTIQNQLYLINMQWVAVPELSKSKSMGIHIHSCVILAEVCDESLLFDSCYTARMYWWACLPTVAEAQQRSYRQKKNANNFPSFFLTMPPKSVFLRTSTGFVLTSWRISNLKCAYETHMGLALLVGNGSQIYWGGES